MVNHWPQVPLGNLLKHVQRRELVEPNKTYDILGAHWYAKGLYTKDAKPGTQIRAKYLYRIDQGDFVYNRLFGWKGSFAVASEENDGCYVSNEFPCFLVDEERLDGQYLWYYFSRSAAWNEALGLSSGGTPTSRNRLKEAKLLAMCVPLPSLEEQRRIVARIEELAAKVETARALREEAVKEAEALFTSAVNHIWSDQKGWIAKPIGEIASTVSGQVDPKIEPYASLPHINGEVVESGTCRLLPGYNLAKEDGITSGKYHFQAGAILYSKIRPYLRKAVQVPFEGVCSADIYAFEWIDPVVEPRFFMYSLISPQFTEYANARSGRTRIPKLNQKQLFAFNMSYPSLNEQRRIVAYLDDLQAKVNAVRLRQAAAAKALDALLPSILDRAFKGEL